MGETANRFLVTGEYLDPNTGYYYLRARWLNPDTGRFVSTDPHPGVIFDPPTLHRYLYSINDPVNRIDPGGQFSMASVSVSVSISTILTSIMPSITFGVVTIVLIKYLMEPGFRMRYAGIDLIASCANAQLCEAGYHLYNTGNGLIQMASLAIELSKTIIDFSFAVFALNGGIQSVANASTALGRVGHATLLLNSLASLNGTAGSMEGQMRAMDEALNGRRSNINVPHFKAAASPFADNTRTFGGQLLDLLLKLDDF